MLVDCCHLCEYLAFGKILEPNVYFQCFGVECKCLEFVGFFSDACMTSITQIASG